MHWTRYIPLMFVLLWSTGFTTAKFALPYIEPFTLLFIRMLITLVIFAGLVQWFRSAWPSPVQAFHQFVVGSLVHAAYLGGVFAAIKLDMPAGIASLIVGLQPILTAAISSLVFKSRLSKLQWTGLGLGLAGVSLVLLQRDNSGLSSMQTTVLIPILVALFGISIGTLYQKRFGQGVSLVSGSFFQYLGTALWMGILSFGFESRQIEWNFTLISALAWLVIVLSVVAILLLMKMIQEGETSKVASYFYLVPPVTALQGWFFFNEQLNLFALAGIAITVLGVYLVIRTRPA